MDLKHARLVHWSARSRTGEAIGATVSVTAVTRAHLQSFHVVGFTVDRVRYRIRPVTLGAARSMAYGYCL